MKVFTKENTLKGFLAGIFIGLGGCVFLKCPYKEVGAFLFACGLISVILFKLNLYTGKVAYARKFKDIPNLVYMCILNFIGAGIIGLMASTYMQDSALKVVEAKFLVDYWTVFLKAMLCGVCIYLAVELYKKSQSFITVIMPVMLFIAAGFEHCVANAFYFAAARCFTVDALVFSVVGFLGNAAGSIILDILIKNTEN